MASALIYYRSNTADNTGSTISSMALQACSDGWLLIGEVGTDATEACSDDGWRVEEIPLPEEKQEAEEIEPLPMPYPFYDGPQVLIGSSLGQALRDKPEPRARLPPRAAAPRMAAAIQLEGAAAILCACALSPPLKKGKHPMACDTCGHTMQRLMPSDLCSLYWCPRCGTLLAASGANRTPAVPSLVPRLIDFAGHLNGDDHEDLIQAFESLGIRESITTIPPTG